MHKIIYFLYISKLRIWKQIAHSEGIVAHFTRTYICIYLVFAGNAYEGRLYHGIIREDATDGQEVNLDLPLFVRNRKDNGMASFL